MSCRFWWLVKQILAIIFIKGTFCHCHSFGCHFRNPCIISKWRDASKCTPLSKTSILSPLTYRIDKTL